MMCGYAKEAIAASWTGELDAAKAAKLRQHLAICPECAEENARLTAVWERLADLPAPEPSVALRGRWESTLESLGEERGFRWASLWPRKPVWQMAIAAACLVAGLAVGRWPGRTGEIARLREEIAGTREMVALSLLREQSATERLRGVDYSVRTKSLEPEVVAALVRAVNQDPNVNVRLAAIDALSGAAGDARVRRSLVESLGEQESPTVQAALVDYAVDARDPKSVGVLRRFAERADLDPTVRRRARQGAEQLSQYK